MAELGFCRTCSGKVSSEATMCPHCGQPQPFSPHPSQNFMREVRDLVQRNQKIEAIKVLREMQPGLGLKEAKDIVDAM